MDGKCPKDTQRCSQITSDANTICLPKNLNVQTECPIVDMQIVDRNAKDLKSNSWTKL